MKTFIMACVFGGAVVVALSWWNKQMRASEYVKHVHPLVNESVQQMSLSDVGEMDVKKYEHLHVEACRLSNQLTDLASDGERYKKWSDQECVSLMYKTRPYAQKFLAKAHSEE